MEIHLIFVSFVILLFSFRYVKSRDDSQLKGDLASENSGTFFLPMTAFIFVP
jgi:hypothetical protein